MKRLFPASFLVLPFLLGLSLSILYLSCLAAQPVRAQVNSSVVHPLRASKSDIRISTQQPEEEQSSVAGFGYVFDGSGDRIVVLDTLSHSMTGKTIATDSFGHYPWSGAISPVGESLYVALRDSRQVLVVDTASFTPVFSLTVGAGPADIVFRPDGAFAFVANQISNTVSVIDTLRGVVTATLPVGPGPGSLAASPCLDELFVTHTDSQLVTIIDTRQLTVTGSITGFGGILKDITISPAGERAYVTGQDTMQVYVIDTVHQTITGTFTVHGKGRLDAVAVSPDGRQLWVTNHTEGSTFVLDAHTGAIIDVITTGTTISGSWAVEISPASSSPNAYVSSPALGLPDGSLQVINTETYEVIKSNPVGGDPLGMALFPPAKACGFPPSARFIPQESTIPIGAPLTFTNLSTGQPSPTYTWDFGDGSPPFSATHPTHIYPVEGIYTVTLTAQNELGTDSAQGKVVVYQPVSAAFTPTLGLGGVGVPISFTNLSTGTGPVTFTWDFGDDTPVDHRQNPAHTYTTVGDFTVTLTAAGPYDSDWFTGTVSVKYHMLFPQILRCVGEFPPGAVCAVPPVAGFSPQDTQVEVGKPVTFTNQTLADPMTVYHWDFGDSTPESLDRHPVHAYLEEGVYTVTLFVDNILGVDYAYGRVEVYLPAFARFFTGEKWAYVHRPVTFTNLSTGTGPLDYSWNFGDETPLSSEINPVHLYTQPGIYIASLTVTGPYNVSTIFKTVQVLELIYMPTIFSAYPSD